MNKLVKSVDRDDLITEFLMSLNGILRLTDRELELMAEFIRLDINYVKGPNENKNIANRLNRKHIISTLGITKDNLSRYIKSFKQKGILVSGPAEDELSVNKALIPEIIGDRVQVTIIIKINERNSN
jgi:hypothetical protein